MKNKTLFISSWFPPMKGGPVNLFNHLHLLNEVLFDVITSFEIFSLTSLDAERWLKCCYFFFDYKPHLTKSESSVSLADTPKRFGFLDFVFDFIFKCLSVLAPETKKQVIVSFGSLFSHIFKVFLYSTLRLLVGSYKSVVLISDGGWCLCGGFLAAKVTRTPYFVYLFDLYEDNFLPRANKFLARRIEKHIFKGAKKLIVTNEKTKDFYSKKYPGIVIEVVYNTTDTKEAPRGEKPISEPISIVYTGGLTWPQKSAVENLLSALEKGSEDRFRFDAYIINCPKDIQDRIQKLGSRARLSEVRQTEIPTVLNQADFLFLPMGWNTLSDEIIRTASPAKMTEYLASPSNVLVHGPEDSYVCEFFRNHNCGVVCSENSVEALSKCLDSLSKMNASELNQKFQRKRNVYKRLFGLNENSKNLAKYLEINST